MPLTPSPGLRPIAPGDDAFLLELYVSTRDDLVGASAGDEVLAPLLRMQFEARESQYAAAHPAASRDLILVRDEPVGRLTVDRTGEDLVLVDVALLSSERGRGLGGQILAELLREAQQSRRDVSLSVLRSNPAQRLYRRMGFVETGDDDMYLSMRWSASHPGAAR